MKFSPEVEQRIIAALAERMPNRTLGACSLCKTARWELQQGYVVLSATDDPQRLFLGGSTLPCAVLICVNCGNTHLLNLLMLGLDALL